METHITPISWISALQALHNPSSALKQKVLDTVIFDNIEAYRPKDWVYSNLSSCIELKNIRTLTLDDVIRGFLENIHKAKKLNPRQSSRPYLVTIILSETRRVLIDTLTLWNIQSNFPKGVLAIQLFDIPNVVFHNLVFIYEKNPGEIDRVLCRPAVSSRVNEVDSEDSEISILIRRDSEEIVKMIEKSLKCCVLGVRVMFKFDNTNKQTWLAGIESCIAAKSVEVRRNKSAGRLITQISRIHSANTRYPFGSGRRLQSRAHTPTLSSRNTPSRDIITLPSSRQSNLRPTVTPLLSSRPATSKDTSTSHLDSKLSHNRSKSETSLLTKPLEEFAAPEPVPKLIKLQAPARSKFSKCGGDFCHNINIRVPPYDKQIRYYVNSRYIKLARLHKLSYSILQDLSIPGPGLLQQIKEPNRFETFIQRALGGTSSLKVLDLSKENKKSVNIVGVCYKCVVVYYNMQLKYGL